MQNLPVLFLLYKITNIVLDSKYNLTTRKGHQNSKNNSDAAGVLRVIRVWGYT